VGHMMWRDVECINIHQCPGAANFILLAARLPMLYA
jgi:hypothetical protein